MGDAVKGRGEKWKYSSKKLSWNSQTEILGFGYVSTSSWKFIYLFFLGKKNQTKTPKNPKTKTQTQQDNTLGVI